MTFQPPVKVFLSYAHDDEENGQLCSKIIKHLSPMGQLWDNLIDLWHDAHIRTGDNWRSERDRRMAESVLFVFLHSSSFTNSKECAVEYEHAEQRERDGVRLIMVRLRPALEPEKIKNRQWTPRGSRPVSCFRDKDSIFKTVAADIMVEVRAIIAGGSSNSSQGTTS